MRSYVYSLKDILYALGLTVALVILLAALWLGLYTLGYQLTGKSPESPDYFINTHIRPKGEI